MKDEHLKEFEAKLSDQATTIEEDEHEIETIVDETSNERFEPVKESILGFGPKQ